MSDRKPDETLVSNVSDTARWVAWYRAAETQRPDALFKDPLAERLAGDKGRAIVERVKAQMHNGWPMSSTSPRASTRAPTGSTCRPR